MLKRKLTEAETKLEFICLALQLQDKAENMKAQNPTDLAMVTLLQQSAQAIFAMTEALFGPIEVV